MSAAVVVHSVRLPVVSGRHTAASGAEPPTHPRTGAVRRAAGSLHHGNLPGYLLEPSTSDLHILQTVRSSDEHIVMYVENKTTSCPEDFGENLNRSSRVNRVLAGDL